MKYPCGGDVVSRKPSSTRPGWVRQGIDVGVGVSVGGEGVSVDIDSGIEVMGARVGERGGGIEGEQEVIPATSESSIVIRIVA